MGHKLELSSKCWQEKAAGDLGPSSGLDSRTVNASAACNTVFFYLPLVGVGAYWVHFLLSDLQAAREPGGGSRGPCRPTDKTGCMSPPSTHTPTASVPFFTFLGMQSSPRRTNLTQRHPLPQCPLGRYWTLHLGLLNSVSRGLYSPAGGQAVPPHPLPSIQSGLLPPAILPPQDKPRHFSKAQTQHCPSLLRTIHGSQCPKRVQTSNHNLQPLTRSGSWGLLSLTF